MRNAPFLTQIPSFGVASGLADTLGRQKAVCFFPNDIPLKLANGTIRWFTGAKGTRGPALGTDNERVHGGKKAAPHRHRL